MKKLIKSKVFFGSTISSASFSVCKRYRYSLTREWGDNGKRLLYILLNPSTATESENDATVVRCQCRAEKLGFTSFRICNLFALRSKNPRLLSLSASPIGLENDRIIKKSILWSHVVICAWGNLGNYLNRDFVIRNHLLKLNRPCFHFGLTKNNQPKHPLYVPYSQEYIAWF